MSVDNKRIAKNTSFLFFRMLLSMFIGLFSVRIILQALGEVDYGIYNVVGGIVTMLVFINNALSSATQRFLSFELGRHNYDKLKSIFATSMCLYGILCVVIVIFAETIGLWFVNTHLNIPGSRMFAANCVYQLSIISFLLSILQAPYNATIIANEEMGIYAYVSIGESCLKFGMVFILLYVGNEKLILYAIMMTLITCLVFIFYKIYCNKNFKESKFKYQLNKTIAHELFSFAGWSTWGALSNIFRGQGVNIVLNIFCGVVVNTARGIAFQLDNAVNSLAQNFYVAVKPQIIKSFSTNNYEEVRNLVHMSTRLGYYLMLMPSIVFLLEIDEILFLWLGHVPQYTSIFTKLVLINNVVLAIATPMMIVVHASGRIGRYQFFSGLTHMLVLPFVFIFVKYTRDPIYAFTIAIPFSMIYCWICFYYASKYVKMSTYWYLRLLATLLLVTLFSLIIPLFIYYSLPEGLTRLIVECFVTAFSILIVVLLIGLKKNERHAIFRIIKKHI